MMSFSLRSFRKLLREKVRQKLSANLPSLPRSPQGAGAPPPLHRTTNAPGAWLCNNLPNERGAPRNRKSMWGGGAPTPWGLPPGLCVSTSLRFQNRAATDAQQRPRWRAEAAARAEVAAGAEWRRRIRAGYVVEKDSGEKRATWWKRIRVSSRSMALTSRPPRAVQMRSSV